jgi:hypothetical protein
MIRRPFGEALRDLVASVQTAGIEREQIRVVGVYFDLPIEVSLGGKGAATEFFGDLPNWRWRTAFDLPPGRVRVHCEIGESR